MSATFETIVGSRWAAALTALGITEPTDVQLKAIPVLTAHENALVSSETGTGKTFAYALPILNGLSADRSKPEAFIIAPTRELAAQIANRINALTRDASMCALCVGGAGIARQVEKLKAKPRIVIGTPGRLLELMRMRKLSAHEVKTVILDEVDVLFDKNAIDDVRAVVGHTLRDTQCAGFSATINAACETTFASITNGRPFTRIDVRATAATAPIPAGIRHVLIRAEERDKVKIVRSLAHNEVGMKALVFVNNPYKIKQLHERLVFHGVKADQLSSDTPDALRRDVLNRFRHNDTVILVTSDVAARGLDVVDCTHVINYDAPSSATDYLHRAGRVGRMGNGGVVLSIFTAFECRFVPKAEQAFHIKFVEYI